MDGLSICQSITETIKSQLHSDVFCDRYRIGNAFTRKRELTFSNMALYLLNATKNSMSINIEDFSEDFPLLKFPQVSKQAVSKARKGINPDLFRSFYKTSVEKYYQSAPSLKKWNGFHVYAVDGTSLQLPQTDTNVAFFGSTVNQFGAGCAMASVSTLYDLMNDIVLDACIDTYNYGERKFAYHHIDRLESIGIKKDTVILFDRGYPSYEMYRTLQEKGLFFVIRLESKVTSITTLAEEDSLTEYCPRGYKTGSVKLRAIRVTLDDKTVETLVTNIFSWDITVEMFRELYFVRWGIEGKYWEFKEQLEIEEFTGARPSSIQQDFYITMLYTNLASVIKTEADRLIQEEQSGKKNHYQYQANRSFIINRIKKHLVRMLCGMADIRYVLLRIVNCAKRIRSQLQPDRKYERKRKQLRRKHHNNRKTCL